MTSWRQLARRLGVGRAAYRCWHAPIAAVRDSIAAGGPIEQWRDRRAHAAMSAAVNQLTAQALPRATDGPEVHFLTGARFWDQTAWCLYTLQAHAQKEFRTVFHDDGSTDAAVRSRLERLFPRARWQSAADARVALDRVLPAARYPTLHERWGAIPNFRKLLDVHAGQTGWRLVLDSDMLFFRRPDFLLDWLGNPDRPLYMVDVIESYGYPRKLLESIAGGPVPSRLNVGICGLRSDALDWDRIEAWCRRLHEAAGTSYFVDQALTAILLCGERCAVAPAEDYLVLPTEAECRAPHAVLHHYVAGSKRGYFRHAWIHARARCGAATP